MDIDGYFNSLLWFQRVCHGTLYIVSFPGCCSFVNEEICGIFIRPVSTVAVSGRSTSNRMLSGFPGECPVSGFEAGCGRK